MPATSLLKLPLSTVILLVKFPSILSVAVAPGSNAPSNSWPSAIFISLLPLSEISGATVSITTPDNSIGKIKLVKSISSPVELIPVIANGFAV